jgi:membrane fusion protein (multidrug efflux system)
MRRENSIHILSDRPEEAVESQYSRPSDDNLISNKGLRAVPAETGSQAPGARSESTPAGEQTAFRPGSSGDSQSSTASGGQSSKAGRRKKLGLMGLGAVLLMGAAWFAYDYITVGRFIVSTDDAYVGADMALISPKIPAYVADVPIVENQPVSKGDVLVRLDDGDYRLALDSAKAKLATQKAAITAFAAQIKAAEAQAAQAGAELDAAKATVLKTEADYKRTSALAARDYSTKAALDAALAARDSARAKVEADEAAIASAKANVSVLEAQRTEAQRVAKQLEVAVAKAERDLSFAVIRAPFDGVVGNRAVQVGDYVTPGKRLAAVVPLDKVYVDANLKETQLGSIVPGETASVEVDALDGTVLKGTVESVAPASGSQFSLLPPENATGNFTKIVQRVPVRISIPAAEAKGRLRPGLSVVVGIDTRTAPERPKQQQASN